jgi:pimeloyl-ACP methyl ester carboxylesterase
MKKIFTTLLALATCTIAFSQAAYIQPSPTGKNDTITPPMVAEEFKKLLPNSELHWIDKCGHAPMMEVPGEFNVILNDFLNKH